MDIGIFGMWLIMLYPIELRTSFLGLGYLGWVTSEEVAYYGIIPSGSD